VLQPPMTVRSAVDLWSLRVFMEVAASESMTIAAKRLNMTQPAVSHVMRRLESALAVTLFDRERRPVALTAAGRRLRARADTLLHDAAQLPAAVLKTEAAPDIRIGLVDTFAATAGPGLIRRLLPQTARIVVWSGLSPALGAALLDREVDLIISSDSLDDTEDLQQFMLWRDSNSNWSFGCISFTVRVGPRRGAAVLSRSGSA